MQASVLQDARYPEGATMTIEIYKRYLRQAQAKAATAKAKTKGPDNSEQARRMRSAIRAYSGGLELRRARLTRTTTPPQYRL